MVTIIFESFNVPELFIAILVVLSSYSVGKFTGIVADLGDGFTAFVAILDGYALAGRDITDYLIKILNEVDVSLTTNVKREIAKDIKEKIAISQLTLKKKKRISKK